jgi:benzoylformate decarboxylase
VAIEGTVRTATFDLLRRLGLTTIFVLVNGGYAIMDRLAERSGADGPWPKLTSIDIGVMARGQGCASVRVADHTELLERLDGLLPALADRAEPLLLEVVVAPDATFDP